jgi:prophage antirepressor-like protein
MVKLDEQLKLPIVPTSRSNMNHTFLFKDLVDKKFDDGSEKTVRVFGTHSDPHFSGKDICDIMDIKDSKDVLFSTVKETHAGLRSHTGTSL